MTQFCIAYCGILSRHFAVRDRDYTGKLVAEATGFHSAFSQRISGRRRANRRAHRPQRDDLLLMFRDPLAPKPHEPNEANLLRLCDVHNIPVATNIATAEALIHSLDRGDLDWRDIVNPKNNR
jgi:methylglyoxal synthase